MNQFVKQCRYYTGEKENPFQEGIKSLLWDYEKKWVEFNQNPNDESFLEEIISEYQTIGLTKFNEDDGVPMTLKALLLNRYMYWNDGNVDHFKQWYKENYLS